jgi:Ca-activated chloride channel family protein
MTNSSWQTARHRIVVPINDYTPGCSGERHLAGVECSFVSPTPPRTPRQAAALSFACAVTLAAASLAVAAQQAPLFRGGVDLVNVVATVTDRKGALVTDLTAADFEILEDGKPQTVRYFAIDATGDGSQGPELHLGLMVDVSESMGEDIAFTKTAAIKFLNRLQDAVDITVVDFDTEVRVARYSQREFVRAIERIRQQKVTGSTALYDAIGVFLDGAGGQQGRKIMLLYTDGGDNRSSIRYNELLDLLKASDVTVYAIGELQHQSSSTRGVQQLTLRQIAEATGGQAFFPQSVKELDAMYDQVLKQIRAQYTVGYLSTNDKTDGAWRKVEIKIVRKDGRDYRVRSRKGYFGPYLKK